MSLIVLLFLFNIMVNYIVKWFCVLRNDIFCDCFGGKMLLVLMFVLKKYYIFIFICIYVLCIMLYSFGGSWCNMIIKYMEIC